MAEQDPIVNNEEEEEEKRIKHYSSYDHILLVGDGDFSFSLCLAQSFGYASNIVASSLQSYDKVIKMYKNGKSNLEKLKSLGGTILHGVDATKMHLQSELSNRKFDRIIYNFPHAGFHGSEDKDCVILKHQNLVGRFLGSAKKMLRVDGQIHVTHKITRPYDEWDLNGLASKNSLACIECADFNIEDYPGYNNKRGAGSKCDEPFHLGECNTFKFILDPSRKNARKKQKKGCLHAPPQKFQEIPNSLSPPIYSLKQQLIWIDSSNPPTNVNDMNGFPSYAYHKLQNPPNSRSPPIYAVQHQLSWIDSRNPPTVNDMNGFPSYANHKLQNPPNSRTPPIYSVQQQLILIDSRNPPTFVNDMNGFPSCAYQKLQRLPNSISPPIYSVQQQLSLIDSRNPPTCVNDMNGFPSYANHKLQNPPNSRSPPIHPFKQQLSWTDSINSPTCVNDMNGFPSHAGLLDPKRSLENLEELHFMSRSRRFRLQQKLQDLDRRMFEL